MDHGHLNIFLESQHCIRDEVVLKKEEEIQAELIMEIGIIKEIIAVDVEIISHAN